MMLSSISIRLLAEWNAEVKEMLNPQYVLKSDRSIVLQEIRDEEYIARIHRKADMLILEERKIGSMYPTAYRIEQNFEDLEKEFSSYLINKSLNK